MMLSNVHFLKQSHPVAPQVFGEGVDSVKKSLEGIFDDTVPDGKVNINSPAASFPRTIYNQPKCGVDSLMREGVMEPPWLLVALQRRGPSERHRLVCLSCLPVVKRAHCVWHPKCIWSCQTQRGVSTAHQGNACPQEDLEAAGSGKCLLVAATWDFHNVRLA